MTELTVFIYVKFPQAIENLIKILKSHDINVEHSYNIEDLDQSKHQILIIPGGTARKQQEDLGSEGIKKIKEFVENGGGYVGICAGAYLASLPPIDRPNKPGIGLINARYYLPNRTLELKGEIFVRIKNKGIMWMTYHNGTVYDNIDDKNIEIIGVIINIRNIKWKKLIGKACILKSKYGKGNVVVCGPHPEQTKGLEKLTYKLIMMASNKKI